MDFHFLVMENQCWKRGGSLASELTSSRLLCSPHVRDMCIVNFWDE